MTAGAKVGPTAVTNEKSGTLFTAVAHIFCGVVGAGVLGLPNAVSWLGWVAGPLCLTAFFAVALWSSIMLSKLYSVDGIEFARYHHAVRHILGQRAAVTLSVFQLLNLVMVCIAYSITGALSMQTVADLIGSGFRSEWELVLVMGAIELVLSQIPSLEAIWWVSALGTASSLGYVIIALVLGLIYSGNHGGSVGGRSGDSTADKFFNVCSSLGNMGFAYSFSLVLLEIQDTLHQPPPSERTMGGAVKVAVTAAFGFYIATSVACYSALGNDVPGEVLTGFPDAPQWVLVLANTLVVVHMAMAWQVWAQPTYETIESNVKAWQIKRQLKAAGAAAPVSANGDDHATAQHQAGNEPKASPFDVSRSPASLTNPQHQHAAHHLPPLAENPDLEGRSGALAPALSGSTLSHRMTSRASGGIVVVNSAPIPDLLPPGGWKRKHDSAASLSFKDLPGQGAPNLKRQSVISRASSALGSQAMYRLNTGAANEHVPMNAQGYYLPLWQRIALRSLFVGFCTIVAICMPFFSSITGLAGAIMFWPLSIFFPMAMFIKVHKPARATVVLMKLVAVAMLAVAALATVASFRSIIVSWSSYTFFA